MNAPNHTTASPLTAHGVFVEVLGIGVLLKGESGIGKSELGLSLIDRGHRLIADDCVLFQVAGDERIIGRCPPTLQDFLEVRGLGILNIRAMFGDNAICDEKQLQLIINVVCVPPDELPLIDRLHGMHRQINILGCLIPEFSIPVAPGRNLSILVESAVRNQVLKQTGYDATAAFLIRQDAALNPLNTKRDHENHQQ